MEGAVFFGILITGAFFFSFFGVIALLSRTKRQEAELRNLRGDVERLREAYKRETYKSRAADFGAAISKPETVSRAAAILPDGQRPDAAITEIYAPPETAPAEIAAAEITAAESPVPSAGTETIPPESPGRFQASVVSFIRGGNLWAAGGVVLLAVGFGMLIAYLARRGFFTMEMGIAAAAAAGLAMILFGWRFRQKRPVYFLVLQGGGLGLLYLSVFAAHKFTSYFGLPLTMILMLLLVPPAVIMSLFQNSQVLAVLGFAGGFAAPLLLQDGGGNHLFLFFFFLVLNGGVLALAFFKLWKGLNLLAFFFTFSVSLYWAMARYTPELFATSEPFFLIYFVLFTFLGLKSLEDSWLPPGEQRLNHFSDIILILGTPAAAAALQWKVFSFVEHGYAFTALAFSVFYLLLTVLVLRKFPALRPSAEGYLTLAVFLANLALPLELSPAISGAVWAAEGAILFFLGFRASPKTWKGAAADNSRAGDPRVMAAGIAVHIASAIAFICNMSKSRPDPASWRSPVFSGALVIAASALFIAIISGSGRPVTKKTT